METELKTAITGLDGKLDGITDRVDGLEQKFGGFQRQVDAIDLAGKERLVSSPFNSGSAIKKLFDESDSVQRLYKDRRGTAVITFKDQAMAELMQRKTTITESALGSMVSGVMPIDRIPGITAEARQQLRIRDLLYQQMTTLPQVDVIKAAPPLPSIASPVPETSLKPENQMNFVTVSEKIRLLATWIPASRQVLDDLVGLMDYIQSALPYYVNLAEELQLLSGDGTGENLHGLIPQSAAFVKTGLPSGWSRIDAIGYALAQITTARELTPNWVVCHPSDWFSMRLQKDTLGRYILGDPGSVVTPSLFGLTAVYTTSIAQGTFLVGSGSPIASEIRDRMELQVEISTEHMDYFVKNLVAIRAEKRLALIVKRPASYVYGTFSGSSPA